MLFHSYARTVLLVLTLLLPMGAAGSPRAAEPARDETYLLLTFADGELGAVHASDLSDLLSRADGEGRAVFRVRGPDGVVAHFGLTEQPTDVRLATAGEVEAAFAARLAAVKDRGALGGAADASVQTVDTGWSCSADNYCARTTAENTCCVYHWINVKPEAPTDTYYLKPCFQGGGGCLYSPAWSGPHTKGVDYKLTYYCREWTVGSLATQNVWTRVVRGPTSASTIGVSSTTIALSAGWGEKTWTCPAGTM